MKSLLLVFSLFTTLAFAQNNYTISGTIKDKSNGESLYSASVFLKGTGIGTISNEYGFYSITAPEGSYTLVVSYIGYDAYQYEMSLKGDQKIDIEISENTTELGEVTLLSSEAEELNLRQAQMSVATLKVATIKKIPVVLGEVDLVKSIQLLPGVTNSGEGSSGFNVRGGSVDQNLVILDEAIIYNTSHLLGFFSVFNADAIKDMKLYKGAIPARYGGRASSVLDIRQKDGNNKELQVTGGVSLISSRLALEGPSINNKGSFLLAGRASYGHLFLKMTDIKDSAYFYDLNLKTNYELNESNKLFLSAYLGRDALLFDGNFDSTYGNSTVNLRWNHIFNDRLFSNATMIFSEYDYALDFEGLEFKWLASIQNYNAKYDLKYYLSEDLKLSFGVNGIYYKFNPGQVNPTTASSSVNDFRLDEKNAFETGVYMGAAQQLSDKLTAEYGLRYTSFYRLGGKVEQYEDGLPVSYNEETGVYEEGKSLGEKSYGSNDLIEQYHYPEPRLSLSYRWNSHTAVKASYSNITQYIHLLSNTISVSPLDVWTPSDEYIKPQRSNQYALGYFKSFEEKPYELEVEAYYKSIVSRIDYIDGSNLIGNNTIEAELLSGDQRSYGLEISLRKTKGDFTAWLAYTISKTQQRTLGGKAGGPGINSGEWYNASQDRSHDLSISGTYKWNEKWSFASNFVFQTGRPVSYPNAQYVYEDMSIADYGNRNEDRLPVYHRLDVSATYTPQQLASKKWSSEWVFGIYNLYNRQNAASVSFGQNRETGVNEATRTAVFGMIPSVSYNFKF